MSHPSLWFLAEPETGGTPHIPGELGHLHGLLTMRGWDDEAIVELREGRQMEDALCGLLGQSGFLQRLVHLLLGQVAHGLPAAVHPHRHQLLETKRDRSRISGAEQARQVLEWEAGLLDRPP